VDGDPPDRLQQFLAFFFPAIAADIFLSSIERLARKEGLEQGRREGRKEGRKEGLLEGSLWFWTRSLGNQLAGCCREFALSKTSLRCVRYRGC